ncbi:MAG: hypothetical protein V4657_01190 [Pseudomonadota bacterium]
MPKMTDAELRTLVCKRRDASASYMKNGQTKDRKEALQFYKGENLNLYGDSGAGLSTVVSRDTMEAIESVLPGLMKPFVSGDEVVRYEPTGPEDEEAAKQATEYINYRFSNDNDGFRVIHDALKDGLMFRLGAAKVVCETVEETTSTFYKDATSEELLAVEKDIDGDIMLDEATGTYQFRVTTTQERKLYRVIVMAPEEFLFEETLTDLDDATFLGHMKTASVGDLIAMGLPKDKCMKLQGGDPVTDEKEERFDNEYDEENLATDDLARRVSVLEAYIRVDYEKKGRLQWRRIWVGGNSSDVIFHEEVDDHPFCVWTPIPIPHKLIGMGMHDLTRDIQMQKTALIREQFNNVYLTNRPQREVVEGQVNIEDLLNPTVGGLIRVKSLGNIQDRTVPFMAGGSSGMVEYLDNVRESRTGSTRYNQGMDTESLNKTATGISIIQNASQQRQELIARQFAEGFLKNVFRKMLALVCKYQDKEEVIKLRGEWQPMDPREWKDSYNMSVAVGLGTGNREQMVGQLTNLLQMDQQIIELQGGADGPIVTLANVYEKLKRMIEAMGLKGIENYYSDPGAEQEQQPEQPQEDPAIAKAQADAAVAIQKAQIDAETKIKIAEINAQTDMQIASMNAQPVMGIAA